jgi:hypothetical protein
MVACQVSILTRPEGRVQLAKIQHPLKKAPSVSTSILTRPEGRVQLAAATHPRRCRWFQSSPVPKDGCNSSPILTKRYLAVCIVSILTRPEGRVQHSGKQLCRVNNPSRSPQFQSSPVPKDGCNWPASAGLQPSRSRDVVLIVSILTRPEGRVQRCCQTPCASQSRSVCRSRSVRSNWLPFQSSPVPKDGCNSVTADEVSPHPSREDGCNYRPRTTLLYVCSFNPHPSRRTGATTSVPGSISSYHQCPRQSPVPKDGCNGLPRQFPNVSILTRPEGRVQRQQPCQVRPFHHRMFQSSPVQGRVHESCISVSINPHPSRRTGATSTSVDLHRHLTRPEGRVQRTGASPTVIGA